jgi:hypothetical protein
LEQLITFFSSNQFLQHIHGREGKAGGRGGDKAMERSGGGRLAGETNARETHEPGESAACFGAG